MAKGQKRGNREIKKPKQKKVLPKLDDQLIRPSGLALSGNNTPRSKGKK